MGRKTHEAEGADRLNLATAEAAQTLSSAIAECDAHMRAYLDTALTTTDRSARLNLLGYAMDMVDAAVKLSKAFGKVKGERRQTISVERSAKSTPNIPQNAPNSDAVPTRKPKQSTEKRDALALGKGGGG